MVSNRVYEQEVTGKGLIVNSVLPRFFLALLISFIGTVVSTLFIPAGVSTVIMFVPLIVLIGLLLKAVFTENKAGRDGMSTYGLKIPMWVVYGFTLLMGIGLAPILGMYIDDMGMVLVMVAFGATATLFGSLFVYTYVTKKDFSFLGGMLFFMLIGIILFSVVGFFVQSDILQVGIAFVTVLVFSGYMLSDISRMKYSGFTEEDVPSAVFDLYLNFFNLFLSILRILNFFRD